MAELWVDSPQGAPGFTVSIGMSVLESDADSFEALMNRPDTALLEAKKRGKNRSIRTP